MEIGEALLIILSLFIGIFLILVLSYGLMFVYMHYECKDVGSVKCNWFECECGIDYTINQQLFFNNSSCSINGKVVDCSLMKYPYTNI